MLIIDLGSTAAADHRVAAVCVVVSVALSRLLVCGEPVARSDAYLAGPLARLRCAGYRGEPSGISAARILRIRDVRLVPESIYRGTGRGSAGLHNVRFHRARAVGDREPLL